METDKATISIIARCAGTFNPLIEDGSNISPKDPAYTITPETDITLGKVSQRSGYTADISWKDMTAVQRANMQNLENKFPFLVNSVSNTDLKAKAAAENVSTNTLLMHYLGQVVTEQNAAIIANADGTQIGTIKNPRIGTAAMVGGELHTLSFPIKMPVKEIHKTIHDIVKSGKVPAEYAGSEGVIAMVSTMPETETAFPTPPNGIGLMIARGSVNARGETNITLTGNHGIFNGMQLQAMATALKGKIQGKVDTVETPPLVFVAGAGKTRTPLIKFRHGHRDPETNELIEKEDSDT